MTRNKYLHYVLKVTTMDDYRTLCKEIFGTDDVDELKKIAQRQKAGRKSELSEDDVRRAIAMQCKGMSVATIAEHFGVSRQTMSKYLNRSKNEHYSLRLDFMFRQKVCTEIFVDFLNKRISIVNRTDDILHRAFGVVESPTWEDFEQFIASRCFPESRGNKKEVLTKLGLHSYDPLDIIEITKGRMSEDNQYFNISYKRRNSDDS